ncbi:MauE/DoxX family redox-associated membrane protein [Methylomarinum sp. Ch1-1]|uniref:Methylamine utilization protein MauE n=1 Tax=Methylomarinum roseum TaxID=3067653 RepID=A0AAU7NUV7_9GAMM|nr:MauE/DoxX family redox-associated membrane protein [Methylomarinum sp. Ch1-1]MDP4519169.1 hypothetical protein [Methylomarinum sp. Ch1-1]
MSKKPDFKQRDELRGKSYSDYWPLISLIVIAASVGGSLALNAPSGDLSLMHSWMHYFMGFFLCSLAMLKIFHPSAFADGFEMYDLLARHFRAYGYLYPFIELALGLAYFSFWQMPWIYGATIFIMTFGAFGVVSALRRGLDINCPCMGSVLEVPLSTVTLTEDIGMALMAGLMLAMGGGYGIL